MVLTTNTTTGYVFKSILTTSIFVWLGQIVDTVVMNPPFGTRKKGADMDFLFKALKVGIRTISEAFCNILFGRI